MKLHKTKLQQLLDLKGWTQTDLYRVTEELCEIPVSRSMIVNIATGRTVSYNVTTLMKLCVALDVMPNDLIDKKDFIDLLKNTSGNKAPSSKKQKKRSPRKK